MFPAIGHVLLAVRISCEKKDGHEEKEKEKRKIIYLEIHPIELVAVLAYDYGWRHALETCGSHSFYG